MTRVPDLVRWRVLLVHTAYQGRGGEDAVVAAETELLRRYGHDVFVYARHNRDIDGMNRAEFPEGRIV